MASYSECSIILLFWSIIICAHANVDVYRPIHLPLYNITSTRAATLPLRSLMSTSCTNNEGRRPCGICTQAVETSIKYITCSRCSFVFHSSCYYKSTDATNADDILWLCCYCIREELPFTGEDNDTMQSVLTENFSNFDLVNDNLVLEVFA